MSADDEVRAINWLVVNDSSIDISKAQADSNWLYRRYSHFDRHHRIQPARFAEMVFLIRHTKYGIAARGLHTDF